MASKHKLIVHVSDDLLYDVIIKEAKASGKAQSEFIRDIVAKELLDKIIARKEEMNNCYSIFKDDYYGVNSIFNRNYYKTAYPMDMTIDSVRQITKDGVIQLHKIDEIISHDYESVFFGMMSFSLKALMNSVKNEVQGLIPGIVKDKWPELEYGMDVADLNLIFIDRVDVVVKSYTEGDANTKSKVIINIKIHLQASRFLFKSIEYNKDFLRIDFLNIRYHRFKDVAVKGWLSDRYERLLYLKPIREILLGGFFAGLLYRQKEKELLMTEIDNLYLNQDFGQNGMLGVPDRFVKLHMSNEQIKLNLGSFRNAFESVKEKMNGFKRSDGSPDWLK